MNENSVSGEAQDRWLEGRRALVTGGARGLGAAVAEAFAAAGATVAVWDAPTWPDAPVAYGLADVADLATGGKALGDGAHVAAVDVRDVEQVRTEMVRTVAALGGLDIVVCAAGLRTAVTAAAMTDEAWDAVIDTNLHGTYHVLREAVAHLEASGRGRAVVIAAEEGRRGAYGLSHYAAAAWAQIGLAKSLAHEVAESGTAVSVVCPGPMETAMSDDPAYWATLQAGRDGRAVADRIDRGEAEHALRVRHPSSSTYVPVSAVVRAVTYLVAEPGLDLSGAVIDVSAGMAATNTA